MPRHALHPLTENAIQQFVTQPAHALLITGLAGGGKTTVARYVAQALLDLDEAGLTNYAYISTISPVDGKAIPIDSIRQLQRFMTLKVPRSTTAQAIHRVAIIENAHLMTIEAQNAMLKTLEEPPFDTVIILTATSSEAMLPTIQSRVRMLPVVPPALTDIKAHFKAEGHTAADIDKAVMLSGGLPGLTHAILTAESSHPLLAATELARTLLQSTPFERLGMVDGLSRQKQLCIDTLYIMGHMARMAMQRNSGKTTCRWQHILKASYIASEELGMNTQPKLVLTNLMLEL